MQEEEQHDLCVQVCHGGRCHLISLLPPTRVPGHCAGRGTWPSLLQTGACARPQHPPARRPRTGVKVTPPSAPLSTVCAQPARHLRPCRLCPYLPGRCHEVFSLHLAHVEGPPWSKPQKLTTNRKPCVPVSTDCHGQEAQGWDRSFYFFAVLRSHSGLCTGWVSRSHNFRFCFFAVVVF